MATRNRDVSRVVIGVDPHKRIDAVVVLDEAGAVLTRETIEHTSSGFRTLTTLARRFPRRTWAVEGCHGVGKNLAQRLVAGGETVLDVSTRKSSLVRALATNSGRKTDDTDAYSIALVGLRTEDLPVVVRDERAEVLRLLSGRRQELVGLRTQAVCRLHRELVVLIPGGASRRLTAAKARALLAGIRPADEVSRLRKALARDQLADLVAIDKQLAAINVEIRAAVAASQSTLTDLVGIGPVNAAMVIGEVADVARFATRHHFAAYKRHRTRAVEQWRRHPRPGQPGRQPATEPRSAHRREHAGPLPRTRARLLPAQAGRVEDEEGSVAGAEAAHQRQRLPPAARRCRRPRHRGDGPGRADGGGSVIQRG